MDFTLTLQSSAETTEKVTEQNTASLMPTVTYHTFLLPSTM